MAALSVTIPRSTSSAAILLRNHHHEGPVLRNSETATCLYLANGCLGNPRPVWSCSKQANHVPILFDPAMAPRWMRLRYEPLVKANRVDAPPMRRSAPTLPHPGYRDAPHLLGAQRAQARIRAKWAGLERTRVRVQSALQARFGNLREAFAAIDVKCVQLRRGAPRAQRRNATAPRDPAHAARIASAPALASFASFMHASACACTCACTETCTYTSAHTTLLGLLMGLRACVAPFLASVTHR